MNPFAFAQCEMDRKVASFVDKPRPSLDTRKLVTIDTDIKNACTELTMGMLKKLHKIADPVTYPNIARYMMMVATMSPIKCLCVGISPYENGILPTFAGAMSYSPLTCIGCTPSVQVLSQVMSLVAVMIKKAFVRKSKNVDTTKIPTRDEYTARFAMMLRCSYSCLAAGVAFVNASPVITSNTAKRVRAASIFSEWVGGMIEIHSRNQYKLTIVSMGALAESSMNDVFKSYQGAKSNVNYTKTSNPAMLQHMNVSKTEDTTPIDDTITSQERALDEVMGNNPGMTVRAVFRWYTYSDELLLAVVKERAITHMTRLLVDETPEQLLDTFLNTVLKILTNPNMEMNSLMSAITDIRLPAETSHGDDMSTTSGFNPFENQSAMMQANNQQVTQASTVVNPFVSVASEMNATTDTRTSTGPNPNAESSQGPPMVTKRSTIGQMIDPSGKAVSHHVIVLDSMIRTLSETLTSYKDMQGDLSELLIRQAKTYALLRDNRIRSQEEIEELNEYLDSFAEFCTNMMSNMEKAYGVVAALPAVVEGDRGVYEHETHPVGPLMRRADGSTMKDYVYTEIRTNANRMQEINSVMNQSTSQNATSVPPMEMTPGANMMPGVSAQMITSMPMERREDPSLSTTASNTTGAFNPFEVALGISTAPSAHAIVDLSTSGDPNMFQSAKEFVYGCADDMLNELDVEDDQKSEILRTVMRTNWSAKKFTGIHPELVALEYKIRTAKGDMNVLDCLSLIVAEYMSIHNREKPSEDMMRKIFEVLNTDDEDRAGFVCMLPNWIKSSTSAMELINMMNESDDEDQGSVEPDDE